MFTTIAITPADDPSAPSYESDEEYLQRKLEENNLATPPHLFDYTHKTEVHSTHLPQSFALDTTIESIAQNTYSLLNSSPYFDISFITQPQKVREYQLQKRFDASQTGVLKTFTTEDNATIHATYFDRGSDTLVVIGPGFSNEREKMSPFIPIFADYDVVLFDYRGHGSNDASLAEPQNWWATITQSIIGISPKKTWLGNHEEKDVKAVVYGMNQHKNYRRCIGAAICYSTVPFTKLQALAEQQGTKAPFTHLILDGPWLSLENVTQTMSHDLGIVCSPQRGGLQSFWLTTKEWGRHAIKRVAENIFGMHFKTVSILDYLPDITQTPILYWYGKKDLMIPRHEFEIIWHATKAIKTVLITSNPHVWNHLKQKEFYALCCKLFIELPLHEFISCLHDKEKLLTYLLHSLKK